VSIGQSPFEVVYERQPPKMVKYLSNEIKVAEVALVMKGQFPDFNLEDKVVRY
jgi:hypothetical protein